jgi:hypothetical protein
MSVHWVEVPEQYTAEQVAIRMALLAYEASYTLRAEAPTWRPDTPDDELEFHMLAKEQSLYVGQHHARHVYVYFRYDKQSLLISEEPLDPERQTWEHCYPTEDDLYKAAVENLNYEQ